MNGIIIADKPSGWTSHDVVAKLRGALKIKRVGHGGTLDPMATGVLPVLVGCATRAADLITGAEKEYVTGLKLGLVTDTQDITGNVLSNNETSVTAEELAVAYTRFLGAQKQTPPMYSAVRHGGKKLYELARRGIEVPRQQRDVFISDIELLESEGNEFLLRVVCSKGTYIRTLCHDIGASLGCGGTMSSLRRTRAGAFAIDIAHTLDEVLDAISSGDAGKVILPIDSLFSEYPPISLAEKESQRFKNGAACSAGNTADGKYRFYSPDGEFLFLGEVKANGIRVIKGFYTQ